MKRPVALVTACAILGAGLALTASPAAALVNGTLDTSHRSAGALVQLDSDGHLQARCSGFVAAPTAFVTAQHCFPIFGIPDGSPAMVSFDPSSPTPRRPCQGWPTTTRPSAPRRAVMPTMWA